MTDQPNMPGVGRVIICGGGECPTCGRPSTAIIGPCDGCSERFYKTGKFLRRVKPKASSSDEGQSS